MWHLACYLHMSLSLAYWDDSWSHIHLDYISTIVLLLVNNREQEEDNKNNTKSISLLFYLNTLIEIEIMSKCQGNFLQLQILSLFYFWRR